MDKDGPPCDYCREPTYRPVPLMLTLDGEAVYGFCNTRCLAAWLDLCYMPSR